MKTSKDHNIHLRPIGVVKTSFSDNQVKASWPDGIEAEIEVFGEYSAGLDGIEGFSHLILLFFMHKTTEKERRTLTARPRRFVKYGFKLEDLPLLGVFCLDSPHRPNPIGLTIVKLLDKKENILKVSGLDAFNGTQILDIKPYTSRRLKDSVQQPAWLKLLHEQKQP